MTEDHHGIAQADEYDDTVYINEGCNKRPVTSPNQEDYPPRSIPRKLHFLNGRSATHNNKNIMLYLIYFPFT